MKKIFSILLLAGLFAACNSNNTTDAEEGASAAPTTPGIDNVNGNVPDTGETIRLNRPLPTDSSSADTTRDTSTIR